MDQKIKTKWRPKICDVIACLKNFLNQAKNWEIVNEYISVNEPSILYFLSVKVKIIMFSIICFLIKNVRF